MKAWKATDKNGCSFNYSERDGSFLSYTVGETTKLECTKYDRDGEECGHGIHLGRELHDALRYSKKRGFIDARFFECSFSKRDILGEGEDKIRVSSCKVLREVTLDEINLPNAKRLMENIGHIQRLNGKKYDQYDEKEIARYVMETVRRTCALDPGKRNVEVNTIRLHSMEEFDYVRASVWYSVRDSVRASVRASVRDSVLDSLIMENHQNHGRSQLNCILSGGGFFCGVDNDGTAHVIVPALKDGCLDIQPEVRT